jgi:PAS domain S-box-containing protein
MPSDCDFRNRVMTSPVRWMRPIGLLERSRVERYTQAVVETIREPLVVLTRDLRVWTANPSFYRSFQTSREETEDRLFGELGDRQWDIAELRRQLENVLTDDAAFEDFELEREFPKIGKRVMLLNGTRLRQASLADEFILLTIHDITERSEAEAALRTAEAKFGQSRDCRSRDRDHKSFDRLFQQAAHCLATRPLVNGRPLLGLCRNASRGLRRGLRRLAGRNAERGLERPSK